MMPHAVQHRTVSSFLPLYRQHQRLLPIVIVHPRVHVGSSIT